MQNKTLRVCDKGGAVNVNSIGAWWPSDGVLGPVERHPLARHFLERCPEGRHMPRWVENKVNKNNEVRLIINLPPRHLKSLMASIAFPAWCLGMTRRRRSYASVMPRISPTSSPAIAAAS